jgi:hypothetical protein
VSGPDFLGIGAQRAGTTWLHQRLLRHPDIFLPQIKELHFFDERPDLRGYEGEGRPGRPFYYDMDSAEDWGWYRRQFEAGAGVAVRGEITPHYAVLSEPRVALIASIFPRLKIIYILRNPVQRAWSGFRLFWFLEMKNRECRLDAEALRKTIMHPAKLAHGDYRRNTAIWEKYCGRERILYLFYDDIVEDPRRVLARVQDFLGLPVALPDGAEIAEAVNRAPALEMPASIAAALAEYYSGQEEFVAGKFGRTLVL